MAAQIPAPCRRLRVSVRTTPETTGTSMNALFRGDRVARSTIVRAFDPFLNPPELPIWCNGRTRWAGLGRGFHELPPRLRDGSRVMALMGALEHAAPSVGVRRAWSRRRLMYVRLQLRDGRWVRIRAINAADAELLRQFDTGLSETSRRLRYLGWMPPLSVEKAVRWATVDFRDRFALVAVARQGQRKRIVSDCRLVPFPERPGSLEVAIAVADDFQGVGLGRALLQLILGLRAARDIEVVARVRYDNQRMMHLLPGLGFRRTEWELGVVTFVRAPDDPRQAEASSTRRSRAEIMPTTF